MQKINDVFLFKLFEFTEFDDKLKLYKGISSNSNLVLDLYLYAWNSATQSR